MIVLQLYEDPSPTDRHVKAIIYDKYILTRTKVTILEEIHVSETHKHVARDNFVCLTMSSTTIVQIEF